MLSRKIFSLIARPSLAPVAFRNFADHFPTKKHRKLVKNSYVDVFWDDDLKLPHTDFALSGGIQALVDKIKSTADHPVHPKNMGLIMYNCAKYNLYEPAVFEDFERHMIFHKGQFHSRLAFGCLYGALKTNAGTRKGIEFFQQEVVTELEKIKPYEALNLIEAASHNRQLAKEEHHRFISEHLKPKILENWAKKFNPRVNVLITLMDGSHKLEYYDEEIWEPLLTSLKVRESLRGVDRVSHVYELLSELNKSGKFYRDLSEDIAYFKGILQTRPDHLWRYNAEEARFYNYQELKAKRNDYQYPNQVLKWGISEKLRELYISQREANLAEEAARESSTIKLGLEELLVERFKMKKKGELRDADEEDLFYPDAVEEEVELDDETKRKIQAEYDASGLGEELDKDIKMMQDLGNFDKNDKNDKEKSKKKSKGKESEKAKEKDSSSSSDSD